MKVKKIKYKPEFDFILIGISSPEPDYKISWVLSHVFETEFVKKPNLEIINTKFSDFQQFSVFEACFPNSENIIKIIANKCPDGFLIEELKNIDYFILLFVSKDKIDFKKYIELIKSKDEVVAAFIINPEELKSKEKFVFD